MVKVTVTIAVGAELDYWLSNPANKNKFLTINNGRIPIRNKLMQLTGKNVKQADASISNYVSNRRNEKLIQTCPSANTVKVGGPTKRKRLSDYHHDKDIELVDPQDKIIVQKYIDTRKNEIDTRKKVKNEENLNPQQQHYYDQYRVPLDRNIAVRDKVRNGDALNAKEQQINDDYLLVLDFEKESNRKSAITRN
jgi:hypothetical protein